MRSSLMVLAVGMVLASCGGDDEALIDPPLATGSIEVTTTTSGWDADVDGFGVYLDGEAVDNLEANDKLTLSDLEAGSHQLHLDDIASNCTVAENPIHTVIVADSTVESAFEIECSALPYTVEQLVAEGLSGGYDEGCRAQLINDVGQVAGVCFNNCGSIMFTAMGFLWDDGIVTELPILPEDLTDRGEVLGHNGSSSINHGMPTIWNHDAQLELGEPWRFARQMNETGQVAGQGGTPGRPGYALLWSGATIDLREWGIPEGTRSNALLINDDGLIVVRIGDAPPETYVLLDSNTKVVTPLDPFANVFDLSNGGAVAGDTEDQEAGIWDAGTYHSLHREEWLGSSARDINERGDVAGYTMSTASLTQALLWRSGTAILLGADEGWEESWALRVNDNGTVVGLFRRADGPHSESFVWEDGFLRTLQGPADAPAIAIDLNNRGQIVGVAGSGLCGEAAVLWQKQRPDPD